MLYMHAYIIWLDFNWLHPGSPSPRYLLTQDAMVLVQIVHVEVLQDDSGPFTGGSPVIVREIDDSDWLGTPDSFSGQNGIQTRLLTIKQYSGLEKKNRSHIVELSTSSASSASSSDIIIISSIIIIIVWSSSLSSSLSRAFT